MPVEDEVEMELADNVYILTNGSLLDVAGKLFGMHQLV